MVRDRTILTDCLNAETLAKAVSAAQKSEKPKGKGADRAEEDQRNDRGPGGGKRGGKGKDRRERDRRDNDRGRDRKRDDSRRRDRSRRRGTSPANDGPAKVLKRGK